MQENFPTRPLAFLWHFMKKQPVKFLVCALATIAWAGNDAFFPYLLNRFINKAAQFAGKNLFHESALIITLIVGSWIFMLVVTRMGGFFEAYAVPRFRGQIRLSVFNYAKWHSLEYFSNNFAGSLARKLADLPGSCQTLLETILFQFLPAVILACLILTMMYLASPIFGGIVTGWLILHFTICGFFLRKSNGLYKVQSEAASALSGKVVDAFTNILTVRLFSRAQYEGNYLSAFQQDEIQKSQQCSLNKSTL